MLHQRLFDVLCIVLFAIILELVPYMCIICDIIADIGIGQWFI